MSRQDTDKGSSGKKAGRSLLASSLWRLIQILTAGGFGALYALIYTTRLSQADYATYGVAFTMGSLLTLACNFGLQQTANRFIAKERGAKRLGHIKAYIKSSYLAVLCFSLGTFLLTFALQLYLASFFDEREDRFLLVVIIAANSALAGVSLLSQGILEGFGKFRKVMVLNLCLHLVQITLLGLLLLGRLDVVSVLLVEVAVRLVGVALFGVFVANRYRRLPKADHPPAVTGRILRYGLPIFLNAIGGFLYTKIDVLFVKAYLETSDTANYFLMMYIFNFPLQALGAYIFVLNTEISVCVGEGSYDRIRSLFWRSEKMGALIGLGLAGAFFGASYGVQALLPDYGGTAHLMRLISPLIVVKCIAQIASGGFMVSLGRVRVMALLTISGGLLNVALNFVMIPPWGVDGAVYSTLLGHTLVGIATMIYVVLALRRGKLEA